MQTRIYAISDPMGVTRVQFEITDFKDGKTRRRERRKKIRKN